MTVKRNGIPRRHIIAVFITFVAFLTVAPNGLEPTQADASPQAVLAAQKSKGGKTSSDSVQLPEHIEARKIDEYMAALTDEQVRRL